MLLRNFRKSNQFINKGLESKRNLNYRFYAYGIMLVPMLHLLNWLNITYSSLYFDFRKSHLLYTKNHLQWNMCSFIQSLSFSQTTCSSLDFLVYALFFRLLCSFSSTFKLLFLVIVVPRQLNSVTFFKFYLEL